MRVNYISIKQISIFIVSILFLHSCVNNSNRDSERYYKKLITHYDPAFEESSEIVFIDSGSKKQLTLLIKKDFFRNVSSIGIKDTSYFKRININPHQANLLHDSVLSSLNFHAIPKDVVILDGIHVTFTLIQKRDTSVLSYISPSKYDTAGYKFNIAALNTYQKLFNDSIASCYFNVVRAYLGNTIKPEDVAAYRKLMINNYPGQLQYSPPK